MFNLKIIDRKAVAADKTEPAINVRKSLNINKPLRKLLGFPRYVMFAEQTEYVDPKTGHLYEGVPTYWIAGTDNPKQFRLRAESGELAAKGLADEMRSKLDIPEDTHFVLELTGQTKTEEGIKFHQLKIIIKK